MKTIVPDKVIANMRRSYGRRWKTNRRDVHKRLGKGPYETARNTYGVRAYSKGKSKNCGLPESHIRATKRFGLVFW